MRAPATATGSRQAFSICITASCSSPSPHCRYLMGSLRGGGGALSRALANSARRVSSVKADGLATIAFTSSSSRVLSPPARINLLMKSVTRRVASPRGIPRRMKSFVFIVELFFPVLPLRLSGSSQKSISKESHWRPLCAGKGRGAQSLSAPCDLLYSLRLEEQFPILNLTQVANERRNRQLLRRSRKGQELEPGLLRQPVGLGLVHVLARPHQVFPSVFAAARTRNNVVKATLRRVQDPASILAAVRMPV